MRPSKRTLATLKEEVYRNAVRLIGDACKLYRLGSYPSAFALGVLALEEVGKLNMVDHICDDIQINPDSNPQEFLDRLFSRNMYRSHTNKQVWASDPILKGLTKKLQARAQGALDRAKQDAIYVGYAGRRITRPRKLTASKAMAQIREVRRALHEAGDLGFNGFDCWSTARTRARAARMLQQVDKWYNGLRR
jgi:AbiV family abortive infection protein